MTAAAAVTDRERRLLTELSIGAAASAVAGGALWALGRRTGNRSLAGFGRQSLAWAVVDAALAARGRRGLSRPVGDDAEALAKARRLRTVLSVNAGLDVGYVAGGVALFGRGRRGDGLAVVVQGLFLLWLDLRHARGFRALTGQDSASTQGSAST